MLDQVAFFALFSQVSAAPPTFNEQVNILNSSKTASRLVEPNPRHRTSHQDDREGDDDEAIFAELEAEIENDDNVLVRERGMEALRRQMQDAKKMQENQHGQYNEITDEKEVVRISAREPKCVVHFYHSNFKRCEIMDKHLAKLARKYFATRFFRVFVENVPWLVQRLEIKVLPCVMCFINGISKDRLIGFEELGNADGFETAVLELRLLSSGVIQRPDKTTSDPVYRVASQRHREEDDEIFDLT